MKIKYALFIVALIGLFQNCSAPQADSAPTAVILGPGGYTGGNGDFSSETPTALIATYAPAPLLAGSIATISVSGGTAPYTYRRLSGAGTLTSNRYASPAAAEVALIGIVDALGNSTTLQIPVLTDVPNTGGGTTSPIATPTPVATPNVQALARSRDCNLQEITAVFNIATAINYEWCLVLGRWSSNVEGTNWYHAIKRQQVSPRDLPPALFASPELNQRYGTNSMSNEVYVAFMVNHLLHRNPTQAEAAQLMAVGVQQGQAGVYNAIMSSPAFFQANPFLAPVQNM